MHSVIPFLVRHGYWVLVANVFAEQMGLPIPALPVLLGMGALAGLVSRLNLRRDLRRLDVHILSGPRDGNYHATIRELASLAERKGGRIVNVESAGSMDNIARLRAAAASSTSRSTSSA